MINRPTIAFQIPFPMLLTVDETPDWSVFVLE